MALAPWGNRAACREGYSISIMMGTVQGEPTAQALGWAGHAKQGAGSAARDLQNPSLSSELWAWLWLHSLHQGSSEAAGDGSASEDHGAGSQPQTGRDSVPHQGLPPQPSPGCVLWPWGSKISLNPHCFHIVESISFTSRDQVKPKGGTR